MPLKVYVLTMGRDLHYATRDLADAEYEKEVTEEDTLLGRKLGIKITEVSIDVDKPDEEVKLANGCKYKVGDILELL